MSIFDRILKRNAGGATAPWRAEHEQKRATCDARVPPNASGTRGQTLVTVLLPVLSSDPAFFERWSGLIWFSLQQSTIAPNAAAGLLWCRQCVHGTFLIGPAKSGQIDECSSCHREGHVRYIEYSRETGKEIHELFERHWTCCDFIRRARAETAPTEAVRIYGQAEKICRDIGNDRLLLEILRSIGDLQETARGAGAGMPMFEESARLSELLDEPMQLAETLVSIEESYRRRGDPGMAQVVIRQAFDLCRGREPGVRDWLTLSTINSHRAILCASRSGWVAEAMPFALEADRCHDRLYAAAPELARTAASRDPRQRTSDLVRKMVDQFGKGPVAMFKSAEQAMERGDRDKTVQILAEARAVLRAMEDDEALLMFSNQQLMLLFRAGALGDALASSEEAETLARKLDHLPSLVVALHHQGQLLAVLDKPAEAAKKNAELKQVEKGLEELKARTPVLERLIEQACAQSRFAEAHALSNELLQSLRQQGKKLEVGVALYRHGALEAQMDDPLAALRSMERLEALGYIDPQFDAAIPEGLFFQADQLVRLGRSWLALLRLQRSADGYLKTAKQFAGHSEHASLAGEAVDRLVRVTGAMRALGDGFIAAGDLSRAIEAYRGTVDVERSTLTIAPRHTEMRFRYVLDLSELGATLTKGKEKQKAEGATMVRDADRLFRQLDAEDPSGVAARGEARTALQQRLTLLDRGTA